MFTFLDLQSEVKKGATRDQSGTQFDTAIKNAINSSLFRLSREAIWRVMRRKTFFATNTTFTIGSGNGSYTNNSTAVNISAANFLTNNIEIGRRIKFSGQSTFNIIRTITGEEALGIDKAYSGTSTTTGTYSILGQEEYNLPIQSGHRTFLWHEEFGFPIRMDYVTTQEFYDIVHNNTSEAVPEIYRMWGEDMVRTQLRKPSLLRVRSTDSGDTNIVISVFGTVAGFPDSETITTDASDGTTNITSTNTYESIERVSKGASSTGRIIVEDSDGNDEVAVMPTGDTTAGILYKKIQIYPLPNTQFDINVYYYKDPYRLVGDNDIHELGQDFDEALIFLSIAKIKYQDSQKEGGKWFALYKDEVRNLRKVNIDKIDWIPTLQRAFSHRHPRVHRNLLFRQVGSFFGPASRF